MAVSWCLSTRQIWPNNFNEIQNMFIFISRFNNVCKKKSCGNINRFPKKIQFYNCQIYGIVLLTPKAKSFSKGKNRQAKIFRASRNFWDGLSDIYLTLIILNQVLLCFVRELPPKFQHQYQLHAFFFFVIPWFKITSLELTFK